MCSRGSGTPPVPSPPLFSPGAAAPRRCPLLAPLMPLAATPPGCPHAAATTARSPHNAVAAPEARRQGFSSPDLGPGAKSQFRSTGGLDSQPGPPWRPPGSPDSSRSPRSPRDRRSSSPTGAGRDSEPWGEPTLRLDPPRLATPQPGGLFSPRSRSPSPSRSGRYGALPVAAAASDWAAGSFSAVAGGARRPAPVMLSSLLASPRHLGSPRFHVTSSYSPRSASPPSGRAHSCGHSRSSSPGASSSPSSRRRVWPSPDPAITYSVARRMRSSPRALEAIAKEALGQRVAVSRLPSPTDASGALLVPRPLIYDGAKRRPSRAKFEFSGLLNSLLPQPPLEPVSSSSSAAAATGESPLKRRGVRVGSPTGSPQHHSEQQPQQLGLVVDAPGQPRSVAGGRCDDAGSGDTHELLFPPREGRYGSGGDRGAHGEFESPGSSLRSGSPRAAWPQRNRLFNSAVGGASDGSHLTGSSVGSGPSHDSRGQPELALRLASPPSSPRRLAAKAAKVVAGGSASPRRPSPLGGRAPPADPSPGDPPPPQRPSARSTERMLRPVEGPVSASAAAAAAPAGPRPPFVPPSRSGSAPPSRPASVPTSRLAAAPTSRQPSITASRPASVPSSSRFGPGRRSAAPPRQRPSDGGNAAPHAEQADAVAAAAAAAERARSRSSRVPSTQQSSLRGFTTASSTGSMPSSTQLTEMARRNLAASLPPALSVTSSQAEAAAAAPAGGADHRGWSGLADGGGGSDRDMDVADPDGNSGVQYTSWSGFGPRPGGSSERSGRPTGTAAGSSRGGTARGLTRSSDGFTGLSSVYGRSTNASGLARSSDGLHLPGSNRTTHQPYWGSEYAAAAVPAGGAGGGHRTETIRSAWTGAIASDRSTSSGARPGSLRPGAAGGGGLHNMAAVGRAGGGAARGSNTSSTTGTTGTVDLLSALGGPAAQRIQQTPTLLRTAAAAVQTSRRPSSDDRAVAALLNSIGGGGGGVSHDGPVDAPPHAQGQWGRGQPQPFGVAAQQAAAAAGLAGYGGQQAPRGFAELSAAEAAGELALLDVEGVIRDFERSLQDHLEFSLRPTPSRDQQPAAPGRARHQDVRSSSHGRGTGGGGGGGGGAPFPSAASRLADRFALHAALADFRHAFDRLRRRLALHANDPAVADALYGGSSSGGGSRSGGGGAGPHRYSSNPAQTRGAAHGRYDTLAAGAGAGVQQQPWRPSGAGRSASVDSSGLRAALLARSGDVSGAGGRQMAAAERFSRVAAEAVAHYREDVALLLSRVRAVLQPSKDWLRRGSSSGGEGAADDAAAAMRELGLRRRLVSEVLNELQESAHQLGLQLVTLAAAPIDMPSPALSRLRAALNEHLEAAPSAAGGSSGGGAGPAALGGGRGDQYSSLGHGDGATRGGRYSSPSGGGDGAARGGRYSSPGHGRGPFASKAAQALRDVMEGMYPGGVGGDGRGGRRGPATEAMASGGSGSEERTSTVGATAASDSPRSEALRMRDRLASWRRDEAAEWLGDMPTPEGAPGPDHGRGLYPYGAQFRQHHHQHHHGQSRRGAVQTGGWTEEYMEGASSGADDASMSPGSASQPPSAWAGHRTSISTVDGVLQGSTVFTGAGRGLAVAAAQRQSGRSGLAGGSSSQLGPELLQDDTPPEPWRAGVTALRLTREAHAARAAASAAREAALAAAREAAAAVGLQAVQSQALEVVMGAVQEAAQLTAREAAAAAADRQAAQAAAAAAVREVQEAAQAAAREAASVTALEAAVVAERQYLQVAAREAAQVDALEAAVSAVREAAEATARQAAVAAAERQAAQAAALQAAQMSVHEAAAAAERGAAEEAARQAAVERQAAQIAALEAAQVAAREAAAVAARDAAELATREAAAVARDAAHAAAREAAQVMAREAAATAVREATQAAARDAAVAAAREAAAASAREAAAMAAAREAAQATAREAAAAAAAREAAQAAALEAAAAAERQAALAAERESVQKEALEAAVKAAKDAAEAARETVAAAALEAAQASARDLAAAEQREAARVSALEEAVSVAQEMARSIAQELAAATEREAAAKTERDAAVAAAWEAAAAAERRAAQAAEREVAAAAALETAVKAAREAAQETALATAREAADAAAREAAALAERESLAATAREAATVAAAREVAEAVAREAAAASEVALAAAREAAAAAERHAAQAAERESAQASALEATLVTAREVAMLTAREIACESAREATIASAREAVAIAERQSAWVTELGATRRSAFEAAMSMARDVAGQAAARDAAAMDMRELAAAAAQEAAEAVFREAVFREAAAMSAQESAFSAAREEAAMAARDAAVAAARAAAAAAAEGAAAAAAERETATAAAALAAEAATRATLLEASQRAAPFRGLEDAHVAGAGSRTTATSVGRHPSRRAKFDLAAAAPHLDAGAGTSEVPASAAAQSVSYRAVVWEVPQPLRAVDASHPASPPAPGLGPSDDRHKQAADAAASPAARRIVVQTHGNAPSPFEDGSGLAVAAAVAAATAAFDASHAPGPAPPPRSAATSPRKPGPGRTVASQPAQLAAATEMPPPRVPSRERTRDPAAGGRHGTDDEINDGPVGRGHHDGAGGERRHGRSRSGIPRVFTDAEGVGSGGGKADAESTAAASGSAGGGGAGPSRRVVIADLSSSAEQTLEDFRLRRQQLAASPPSRPRPASATATPFHHHNLYAAGLRERSWGSSSSVVQQPAETSDGTASSLRASAVLAAATVGALGDGARRDIREFQLTKQRLGLVDASSPPPPQPPQPSAISAAHDAPGAAKPSRQHTAGGSRSLSASRGSTSPNRGPALATTLSGASLASGASALREQDSEGVGEREAQRDSRGQLMDPQELAQRLRRLTDRTTQLQQRVSRLTLPLGML